MKTFVLTHKSMVRIGMTFFGAAAMFAAASGCMANLFPIPPGDYAGEVSCTLQVTAPDGQSAEAPFTESLVVNVGTQDSLTINDVPVAIGELHTRSLPNADMAFEIVGVRHVRGGVEVTYEPRPTLPGIEAQGDLVETYRRQGGSLGVTADANLMLHDAEGATTLVVSCDGTLDPSN